MEILVGLSASLKHAKLVAKGEVLWGQRMTGLQAREDGAQDEGIASDHAILETV